MQLVKVSSSYEQCVMVNENEQSIIQACYAASHALWPGTYAGCIVFILDTLLTQSQDQSHVTRLSLLGKSLATVIIRIERQTIKY